MDLINPKVFKNMRVVGADDMSDYNYESIRTCILEWYKMIVIKYPESNIVISKNCENALIIDFDFEHCLAQLSVTKSENVPFQFIHFKAADLSVSNYQETGPIYYFYDDQAMKKADVITALDRAIQFCSNFKSFPK